MLQETAPQLDLKALRTRRLYATAGIVALAALADIPIVLAEATPSLLILGLAITVMLVSGITILLARQGYTTAASWLFTLTVLIGVVIAIPPTTAVATSFSTTYVIPIIIAGLVGSYHMTLFVGSGLSLIVLGTLIVDQTIDAGITATFALILAVITGLLWLVLRDLQQSLRQSLLLAEQTNLALHEATEQRATAEQRNQQLQLANQQQSRLLETIQDLETPILTIQDHLLVVPLIGHVDSQRAQKIADRVLSAAHDYKARGVILDISGVAVVDTQVIQRVIQLIQTLQLVGTHVIITGVTPAVAQTMSALGIDFGNDVLSSGTLQDGLRSMYVQPAARARA